MKTSEEQGLSLFPDADFPTCPVHAIAMALITQTAPCVALIDNLLEIPVEAAVTLTPATPLVEVLNNPDEFAALASIAATKPVAGTPKPIASVPTVYSHVNRLLERVAPPAGVVDAVTSHSFRRGGAQHVNGCQTLTHRWIFDRGAWNMSTTNKGFNYIFNISKEDHRITKALSSYSTGAEVKAMNLTALDAETMEKIYAFQRSLFTSCYKKEGFMYNLSQQVSDVLTAYLILHYPRMKELQANGLAVTRMEADVVNARASVAELLAWSSHLAVCGNENPKPSQEALHSPKKPSNESKIIQHQSSVIDQLLQHITSQDERMDNLEAKMEGAPLQDKSKKRQHLEPSEQEDKPRRRQTSVAYLHATWFAWYAQEPRWMAGAPKRQRSNAKQLVALMKLFVADKLKLDPCTADYRDQVLALGKKAEEAVLAFLNAREIKSRGSTAIRKRLLALYMNNDKIARHLQLRRAAIIHDPDRQDALEPTYTQARKSIYMATSNHRNLTGKTTSITCG
ncbi:unnamed protein product [Phytophthora fragariaefolia]|uniref:Unnamed protein product n=1 Tax=Phytophthora fragariaefolia TaxID=1490495 RepID=A0A9W6Y8A3_9STRA|nr:unnamed protein product [Phytophthora fragariaefolia]